MASFNRSFKSFILGAAFLFSLQIHANPVQCIAFFQIPTTAEEKLALIESTARQLGISWTNPANLSDQRARRILSRIDQTNFQNLSQYRTYEFLENIYRLSNEPVWWDFRRQIGSAFSFNLEPLFRKRLTLAVMSQNLYSNLSQMGLEPASRPGQLRDFFRRYNVLGVAFSAAVNAVTVLSTSLPVHFPARVRPLRAATVSPAIIQTLELQGFEAALQQYTQENRFPGLFEKIYPHAARVYLAAISIGITFFIVDLSVVTAITDFNAPVTIESVEVLDTLRDEQYESWFQGYTELTGQEPSPELQAQKRAELAAMSEANFGVQIRN